MSDKSLDDTPANDTSASDTTVSDTLHVQHRDNGVVLIEIDRPPANALDLATRTRLEAVLDGIETDLTVRAVVLTGRGKSFCAGDDLREAMTRGDDALASLSQFGRLLDKIEALRVPVIAAVNGACVGGGLELALCCDVRVASEKAFFIGAGVNVGLMASVYRLPRLIGIAQAKAMLLTGLRTQAQAALAYGLVTAVHPHESLLNEAMAVADRIASRAPLSVEATKRMVGQAFDLDPQEAAAAIGREVAPLAKSDDHKAGILAFVSREEPVFNRR